MTSKFVLGNETLQYLASTISTRFQLYAAVYNPVQILVQSQDIQTNQYGQYTNISNVDLLAKGVAPYAPQPNFGPNRIGFVGEALFFDGSRSTQRGNLPPTQYTWSTDAPSSSVTIATYNHQYGGAGSQASIVFSAAGLYTVSLAVQDRFGVWTTGHRQVMIYPNRTTTPHGVINIGSLTGSLDSGGWSASITTALRGLNIALPDALPIGSFQPITIIAETEYEVAPGIWRTVEFGPYAAPVPGQYYDDPRVVFVGYIQSGTAEQDSEHDTVSFQISGPQLVLQQAGIHNIGYYNSTYKTRNASGIPTSLNASSVGIGQLVADLTSEDVYRSLLLDHSNFGLYHDVIIWRDMLTAPNLIPWQPQGSYTWNAAPGTPNAVYYLTYSTLTATEGTIWQACMTLAQNEYADMWCDQRGMLCVGPTVNMRGYEMVNQPTIYGPVYLGEILNYTSELNNSNAMASQAAYLNFLFGPNALPQPLETSTSVSRDLSSLIGPPILCHFSDVPVYDTDASAPKNPNLLPWVTANWPQDLSIRPMKTSVSENYTTRTQFVKLITTLVSGAAVWSAWYPLNTFDTTGLMQYTVGAGQWDVESSILLPDATINQDTTARQRSWQFLWELARRRYNVLNAAYTIQIDGAMWPFVRLHDIFRVTRQLAQSGPSFHAMPFYTSSVTHTIDPDKQTWSTSISGTQITNLGITPLITPPFAPPTNNT